MADYDAPQSGNHSGNGHHSLGLAGNMAKEFIHSPLSPILFFAMLALGLLGLVFTPRQEDPQISVPMVDIFVQFPGGSADQVASLAIDPLERIMSEIPGVKHVYSAAQRGQGMVTVRFKVGEQLGPSLVKVYDKLESNKDRIPPGVPAPLVKPKGIDDVPVVTLTLWSPDVDDGALRTLALDVLQSLKQVPNTGQGFIVGGRSEQIRVEVMPERLSGFNIGLDRVAGAIQTANAETAAGSMEMGDTHFTVYSGSFLRSADDVKRLVVGTHAGSPIYVRDVARVFQAPEETGQMVSYYTGPAYEGEMPVEHGVPAVTIAVSKKVGTNGVTVANAILDKVEQLKGRLIPDNVQVALTRNYGETANEKVNELIFKLFVATAAVALLVWMALGIRPAIVVLAVIPVVILITVFSAWILGFTIDRVSLFALIFSIGILVDDAIVVVENIYRRWLQHGETDTDTAVDAVREVGNPTILATFTVVAALLPMGFVSGMMGPYMAPIPALGSVAMIFSLIAAFIFTPWLAMRIKPSIEALHKAEQREHATNEKLEKLFRKILVPLISNRLLGWGFLVGVVAIFFACCAMFYTTAVTVKMLPFDNKPEFNVVIDMPEGTALPVTANLTARLVEKLRQLPEVTYLQSYVGTAMPFDFNGMVRHYYLRNKPWHADIHVQLKDKSERDRKSHEIAVAARELITKVARDVGARVAVVEMPPGPPVLESVVAEVYGPDANTRRQVAADLTAMFEKATILTDVDNYMQQPHEVWRFEVDTEKAVRRGVSVDTINRTLSMAMGGFRLGDVKQGSLLDPLYIVMQIPLAVRGQIARLSDLPVPAQSGSTVPLAEVGRFVRAVEDPIIYHKDLRPVEYVVADTQGRLGAPIYGMFEVEKMLADYTAPDGVKLDGGYLGPPDGDGKSAFEWTGEWTVTYETFRDMGLAFGAALVLIYVLVVWEFGNFVIPAIIMAPIPLTLIGIIPGHWFLGAEFTATSMIGFIALAGIIVRNSILLVDFSIQSVQGGATVQDAVILSCKTRTRPILITAFALVLGSSVILFDPIFQGMAISLLFGVMVSTLLTLVVIPLGCMSARSAICPADVPSSNCDVEPPYRPGLLFRIWSALFTVVQTLFYLVRGIFLLIGSLLGSLLGKGGARREEEVSAPPSAASPAPVPVEPKVEEVLAAAAPPKAEELVAERAGEGPGAVADETPANPATIPAASPSSPAQSGEGGAPAETPREDSGRKEMSTAPAAVESADRTDSEVVKPPVKKAVAPKRRAPAKKEGAVGEATVKRAPAKKKAPIKKKGARRGIRLKALDDGGANEDGED
ncbi:efflux RND transporter permease subunit [Endothiovibrio diazotrophicus]